MKKSVYLAVVCVVVFGLTACVTVTDNPKRKVDKVKVLESNVKLGRAYLGQNQRDNALRAFVKALEIDNKSAESHQGMALVHQMNGETEEAEKSFKKALKYRAGQSSADIEFTYGRFLARQNNCLQAIPYFEKASKDLTYQQRPRVLFNLGLCADKMGNEERAMAAYQHALNLNERFAPAAMELSHKMFAKGEYSQAKRYLDLYGKYARQSARSLWLGVRIERIFDNKDKEASYALALKNLHPYSREYLEYKQLQESEK